MTMWHISCRDCDAENTLETTERTVRGLAKMHEDGRPGHTVEYERVES
ncbi:hypothetical protein [Salinigranum marinum]|nr:hypothetical protein [Salinigranum marinum]